MSLPTFTIEHVLEGSQKHSIPKTLQHKQRVEGVTLHQQAIQILNPSFVAIVVGNPGAGKSSLIQQVLNNPKLYNKAFNRVLFIGPTRYKNIVQDQHNTCNNLDIKWIYSHIKKCNEWKAQNMLIVFDDIIGGVKQAAGYKQFISLFFNRRHLLNGGTISIILTTQKWNLLPPWIRTLPNMIFLFPVSPKHLQSIMEDINLSLTRKTFQSLLGSLKKYQFIYCNLQNNKLFNSAWTSI